MVPLFAVPAEGSNGRLKTAVYGCLRFNGSTTLGPDPFRAMGDDGGGGGGGV